MENVTLVQFIAGNDAVKSGGPMKYMLITDKYKTLVLSKEDIIKAIKAKSIYVHNLRLNDSGTELIGHNGSLDNYPILTPAGYKKGPALVILNRFETTEKELVGFTVFFNGTVKEVKNDDIVKNIGTESIVNGKIKVSTAGLKTVSAIQGNYPTRQIEIKKPEQPRTYEARIPLIAASIKDGVVIEYASVMVESENVSTISYVAEKLKEETKKLAAELDKIGALSPGIDIIPTVCGGIYAVVDIKVAYGLLANKSNVGKAKKDAIISVIDYSNNGKEECLMKYVDGEGGKIERDGTHEGAEICVKLARDWMKVK